MRRCAGKVQGELPYHKCHFSGHWRALWAHRCQASKFEAGMQVVVGAGCFQGRIVGGLSSHGDQVRSFALASTCAW